MEIINDDYQSLITRTERGLTIKGTRITIYDVIEYVIAEYPPKFIQGLFELTTDQINAALAYIDFNRAAVEAEYQIVIKETEELRQYYQEQNRELFAQIAAKPPLPGTEVARQKLQKLRAASSNQGLKV